MSDIWNDKDKVADCQYYQLLNLLRVDVNDTDEGKRKVVQKWNEIMKIAHPDKPGGDAAWAKKLNAAKITLTDPEKRQAYNAALDTFSLTDGQRRNPLFDQKMREA